MNRRILFVVLCAFLAASAARGSVLRVLCLNGGWFPGREPTPSAYSEALHMRQVQQLLIEVNPDVLLLQEIRDLASTESLLTVVPDLELHAITAFNQSQELVVASRFPAVAVWAERWMEQPTNTPPRGFAAAVLHLPGDAALAMYTVHFKSNFQAEDSDDRTNAALREEAARQLVDHVSWLRDTWWGHPLIGVIVGGDLNTSYPAPIVRGEQTFPILAGGMLTPRELGGIDHFLTWGAADAAEVTVLGDYRVSDHKPILLAWDLGDDVTWRRARPHKPAWTPTDVALLVNLNEASPTDLEQLPGIGPVLADRIISNRPYAAVEDLDRVPGVGPVTLSRLKALVSTAPTNEPP